MIARLTGEVALIGDGLIIIDVNGVGYQVFCSSRTLESSELGKRVTLEIETHVREDNIQLFGFVDLLERDWFKLLNSVQGVGAKVALAILGFLNPENLIQVISSGDKNVLVASPGVGPKLATRIIGELKDKVGAINTHVYNNSNAVKVNRNVSDKATLINEATSGLVNLGYNQVDAMNALTRVINKEEKEYVVEELIKFGLQELACG